MSRRTIKAILMKVPERELMGDILFHEAGEALPVHVNIDKYKRTNAGFYILAEERDEAVKKRQLANAKERLRVKSLNAMFSHLKRIVPVMPLGRKPSKVDMLRAAAEYIRLLTAVLQDTCVSAPVLQDTSMGSMSSVVHHDLEPSPTGMVTTELFFEEVPPNDLMVHLKPPYQYIVQFAPVDQPPTTLQPVDSTHLELGLIT